MASKTTSKFIAEYLERVNWRVLAEQQAVVRSMIQGHAGVYALYKGEKLYYIGLANNLMGRVKHHLKDRHAAKWDRFSVYLTNDDQHIKPLESLLLRIAAPSGNRVAGKLAGAKDLQAPLKRSIRTATEDNLAVLLGGAHLKRRAKKQAATKTGTLGYAGLLGTRVALRGTYKGQTYRATLRRDGRISYARILYDSPSAACRAIVKRAANGWHFWRFRKGKEWVRLGELRKG